MNTRSRSPHDIDEIKNLHPLSIGKAGYQADKLNYQEVIALVTDTPESVSRDKSMHWQKPYEQPNFGSGPQSQERPKTFYMLYDSWLA
jgi:hypothetical protein